MWEVIGKNQAFDNQFVATNSLTWCSFVQIHLKPSDLFQNSTNWSYRNLTPKYFGKKVVLSTHVTKLSNMMIIFTTQLLFFSKKLCCFLAKK